MRIQISRKELMFQLDQQSKRADEIPDMLYIEGITVLDDEVAAFDAAYPQYVREFTHLERVILRELYLNKDTPVKASRFYSSFNSIRPHTSRGLANNLQVHKKNINRKAQAKQMPFAIVSGELRGRAGIGEIPSYLLKTI